MAETTKIVTLKQNYPLNYCCSGDAEVLTIKVPELALKSHFIFVPDCGDEQGPQGDQHLRLLD